MQRRPSPDAAPRGLTLLEVIVGLTLMGSVMVASLLAFSRHRKQLRLADKRIEAVMIADGLVNELSSQRGGLPVSSRGVVTGRPGWFWQTSPAGVSNLAQIPIQIIRFEILERGESITRLVSVDLAKATEEPLLP